MPLDPAKSAISTAPVSHVTAEKCTKQFQEDLYTDGGVLFCTFCEHCIDFVPITLKRILLVRFKAKLLV